VNYSGAVQDFGAANIADEPPKLAKQALNLLVGECLGQGASRRVYALRNTPDLVLKLEYDNRDFSNVIEWTTWSQLQKTKWAEWLAPCISIDEFSGVLIQARADDLTDEQWAALKEYPAFLGDAGRRNWGWYKGRPVMRDYAFNHLITCGLKNMKMKRWTEKDMEDPRG
jgi:hypothetical protein